MTESVGNQAYNYALSVTHNEEKKAQYNRAGFKGRANWAVAQRPSQLRLSLIHISEPTRPY